MGLLRVVIAIVMLVTIFSCYPTKDLRHFTLYGEPTNVDNNNLKINGIYYTLIPKAANPYESSDYINGFALFENGSFLDLTSVNLENGLPEAIKKIVRVSDKFKYSEDFRHLGVFKIEGDSLHLQYYRNYFIAGVQCKVLSTEALILNDSTIEFKDWYLDSYREAGGKYHFFKTNVKPDSITALMTNKRVRRKLERLYKKRHHTL